MRVLSADKDRAVKIAKKYFEYIDGQHIELTEKYVLNLFDLWKKENGLKPGGLAALFLGKKLPEKERRRRIKSLKPWEAAPAMAGTPLDLFRYLLQTGYVDNNPVILAWLILFSDRQEERAFWPSMVRASLEIAEGIIELQEGVNKDIGESLWKPAKHSRAATRNLKRSPAQDILAAKIKSTIHAEADRLLRQGKNPRTVISIISRREGAVGKRQIRRHLQSHPSGRWRARPIKKK